MEIFPRWLKRLSEIPDVKDILVSGQHCQIDRGAGLETIRLELPANDVIEIELRKLAFDLGARLDISCPVADISHGRFRLHLLLPHGIADIPMLSIRVHLEQQLALADLVESKLVTVPQAEYLASQVALKKTIVISGPTGSGKTTLLRALLAGSEERVVAIEQIPELQLPPPAVSLFARAANQDGRGEITLSDLVAHSLRMRPDRIVVGEIRKGEFSAFLQAVSNGHPGSMTTIHATSLLDVPRRLITLGLISGFTRELTTELVLGAIDLVVQLERVGGTRRLAQLGELSEIEGTLDIRELA